MTHSENNPKSKIQNPKSVGRRQWLLRMGKAAALMSFSGAIGETREGASPAATSAPAGSALPPGLYQPSNDHLSHALSSDTRFRPTPAGSETDYVRPRSGPFQFLAPQEFELVRRVVELIIGDAVTSDHEGDTATAEQVTEWIDLRLSQAAAVREAAQRLAPDHRALAAAYYGSGRVEELETDDSQKTCREGLRWLEEESQQRYRQPFLGLDEGQQLELLRIIADDRPDKSQENAGTRFFDWIKGEIIRGYYTSQAGLKELDYRGNAFYAEPPGCEGHDHST
jgi:Gluconate 2-dehydrogenase subunit 3